MVTWPVLAFLLTAVFAFGFHVGQKLALSEAAGVEPEALPEHALRREAVLSFSHDVVRRSF